MEALAKPLRNHAEAFVRAARLLGATDDEVRSALADSLDLASA